MTILKAAAMSCFALSLAACTDVDKTKDANIWDGKNGDLSAMTAGIWVDPTGCEHWIIDDGVEGYLDLRRTPDGKPVCNSDLEPNTAYGPFKGGTTLPDIL